LTDFLLPIWNPFIVHPLEAGLRALAGPLEQWVGPGLAGGLSIILFTILLRLVLFPLTLVQIRSQRHQLRIQPRLKELQRKYKGDREGMARAQMQLYKEEGINPAAGCVPLLIQLPILFGMYSAMSQLATQGMTLDQVTQSINQPGQIVYAAERTQEPLPFNQFVLMRFEVSPKAPGDIPLSVDQTNSYVRYQGKDLLEANGTLGMTLTPGSVPNANQNPPTTQAGAASIFLRGGVLTDGTLDEPTLDRSKPVQVGQPYVVEVWADASGTNADQAQAQIGYDPTLLDVTVPPTTPVLQDLPFKSQFLWLPSLGQPDTFHIPGLQFSIPGLLLIIMTVSSFLSQRMTTMPTEDPQQQAMMRSMAFMPLMYLFFFLNTPAGLVLYWLTSNIFSMFQQYFTVGLGLLGGDLERLTGRDYQPPWAHIPTTSTAPVAALATSENGVARTNGSTTSTRDGITPGPRPGAAGATRRPRPGPGRGRKRGKR
jgi:YidC/Oxa1 family membrane protein insertase